MKALYLDRHDCITGLTASAALNADRGGRHITIDYGKNCTINSTDRGTVHPNLAHGCPPYTGGQPDIVIVNHTNTTLPDLTAIEDIFETINYLIAMLDVHVVADEKHMAEANKKKRQDNAGVVESLETRHTTSFNPISIGSRIPLIDTSSIYDLHLSPEQLEKLQNRIWHNVLEDLYKIQTTYNSVQQGRAVIPKQFTRPAAIPRRRKPAKP